LLGYPVIFDESLLCRAVKRPAGIVPSEWVMLRFDRIGPCAVPKAVADGLAKGSVWVCAEQPFEAIDVYGSVRVTILNSSERLLSVL
jgi:hypothetical protein